MNFPNRVPVFAKPHDGSSMRNVSSAAKTLSLVDASMRTSPRNGRLQSYRRGGHGFLGQFFSFRIAKQQWHNLRQTTGSQGKTSGVASTETTPVVASLGGPVNFAL